MYVTLEGFLSVRVRVHARHDSHVSFGTPLWNIGTYSVLGRTHKATFPRDSGVAHSPNPPREAFAKVVEVVFSVPVMGEEHSATRAPI